MSYESSAGGKIDQKHAETLARLFNLAYNGAVLYGGSHQTAVDAALPFHAFLARMLSNESMVTLIVERDSVYIENFCIDKIINVRRLVVHFKKAGIQSITFSKEVTVEGIKALLVVLSDAEKYPTAAAMQHGLAMLGGGGIRFNYVVYRKMTTDEKVVNKNAALSLAPSTMDTAVVKQVLDGLSEVVAARQIVEGTPPASPAAAPGEGSPHETNLAALLEQLRAINSRVNAPAGSGGTGSIQEMMESVVNLRRDVNEKLGVIRATHDLNESENLVVNELDAMSHEVILRLLREEYKGGTISIKRLSQITRRMLPDIKELKRMLPRLKESFLKEGMSQSDYLQYVTDILKDIESDGLSGVFEGAVKDIGVSMEELIESVRADPADAARLIVLASEIRKSSHADGAQLSFLLTDYIEKVSSSLCLESKDVSSKEGIRLLKSAIGRIETDLVEKLRDQGIPADIIDKAESLLQTRLDATVVGAKKAWTSRFVTSLKNLSENELVAVVRELYSKEGDADAAQEALHSLLESKGWPEEKIVQFVKKAASKQAAAPQELPKGVLNVNATLYFIEREIKRVQRYGTPFSCVIVTAVRVGSGTDIQKVPTETETKALMPQILTHLRRVLRDLDIVGSLGLVSGDVPFVVLPMTDAAGSSTVVERLHRVLEAATFEINGANVRGTFVISCSSFDKTTMTGYRSFLEYALGRHRKTEGSVHLKQGE
jgi:hypothetical protein